MSAFRSAPVLRVARAAALRSPAVPRLAKIHVGRAATTSSLRVQHPTLSAVYMQSRGYAASSGLSTQEIQNRIVEVLKSFEKVDPAKVSRRQVAATWCCAGRLTGSLHLTSRSATRRPSPPTWDWTAWMQSRSSWPSRRSFPLRFPMQRPTTSPLCSKPSITLPRRPKVSVGGCSPAAGNAHARFSLGSPLNARYGYSRGKAHGPLCPDH